jgi:ABC-type transport system involved in multi-copper enzyme maturation permease subunit
MVGPILHQEMLLGGRRGRAHVFRWLYAAWLVGLVLFFLFVALMEATYRNALARRYHPFDFADLADFARSFLAFLVGQHFVVLALATPALAAGAVADEKARGTLQYLLTAGLLPGEILLGKLLGRCWQVGLLALPVLPLVAFFGAFAGLDLAGLAALALASAVFVLALAAAALLASVWARQARDAVLGLLAAGVVVGLALRGLGELLGPPALPCLRALDPLGLAASSWLQAGPAERWQRLAPFLAAWGGLGAACFAVAAWRLRPAYFRQLAAVGRKKRAWWQARRPPPADDPVRWKERHAEGIAPLAVLRKVPRWVGVLLVFVGTLLSSGGILLDRLPYGVTADTVGEMALRLDLAALAGVAAELYPSAAAFGWQGTVVLLAAGLVVGVRCSGAISGERERQTWEALLMTPLTTRLLVRGKFWGVIGAGLPYLLAYAGPALALSAVGGLNSFVTVALLLGLTALAVFYIGAAGLWCSARARTSWRSLLATLAFAYLGGAALAYVVLLLAAVLMILLALAVWMVTEYYRPWGRWVPGLVFEQAVYVNTCIILALCFLLLSVLLLRGAENWIAARERTRHWEDDEPRYRRPRRAVRAT